MSNKARQSSISLDSIKIPPLVPIRCTKPSECDGTVSRRKLSEFTIDCILAKKHTDDKKATEKLINRVEWNDLLSTRLSPKCGKAIDSKISENSKIPSYTCMIAQAILSSRDRKITLGEIYEYIEREYPTIEDKVKGWRNCVRHNLSLNECFLKIGPSGHGRGNNWSVHPSYVESFLRGHFRKRMASRKRKAQLVEMSNWRETQLNGTEFYKGQILPYQQSSVSDKYLKLVTNGLNSESHRHQCLIGNLPLPHTISPWNHWCPTARDSVGNLQNFHINKSGHYQLQNHPQRICFKSREPVGNVQRSLIHRQSFDTRRNARACKHEEMYSRMKGNPKSIMSTVAGGEDLNNEYMERNFLIHFPGQKTGKFETRVISRVNHT